VEKQIDQNENALVSIEKSTKYSDIQAKEKNKCSIFNYLKEHPAAIIASFSSVVAIITFLSQFLTYIASKNALTYWGFDSTYASFDNNSLLYCTIAAIVYVIIMSFAATWFLKTSDVYIERKKCYLICTLFYKQLKRSFKNNEKQLKKLRLRAHINRKEIFEIEKSVRQTKQDIIELRKEIVKAKRKAHFFFLINVLPILTLTCVFAFILSFMTTPQRDLLKNMLVIFCTHVLTYYLMFSFQKGTQLGKKRLAKDISGQTIRDVIKENQCEHEYPLFSLFVKGDGISNSTFITQGLSIALTFIVLVFTFAFGLTNTEKSKKDFQIMDIDGATYAVVYYDNNTYYLEKASIDQDTLTVFTSEQRIITTSDISFSVQTFDEVVKVDKGEKK
jgi:hypothetical protein